MNNYIYEFLNEKCHDIYIYIYIYIYTYCNKRNDLKSKIQSTV